MRKPTRDEYKVFRSRSRQDAQQADAQENLCRRIVVYPSREDFDRLLDDYPGICEADAVSSVLRELVGMTGDEQGK